jgi:hypothetical protein
MTGRLSEGCLSLAAPASDLHALLNRGGCPDLLQHGEVVMDRLVLDDFLVLNPDHMQTGGSP